MAGKLYAAAISAILLALCGCGSHSSVTPQSSVELSTPAQDLVFDGTTSPVVVHIGFNHAESLSVNFGPVYYYSKMATGAAQVIHVTHGSQLVFRNDDPSWSPHTASGFGTAAFPATFDNTSGFTRSGTRINSTLTWSTGTIPFGQRSQVFIVGVPGHYFFGCHYHYTTKPTSTNGSMGDVIVSI